MKRLEIEEQIKSTEEKINQYQQKLKELKETRDIVIKQEKERRHYISSKEIIDLIHQNTGKKINMSTVKRWADEGYLGNVIDEKDKFWALRSKQGKKRFLYPKVNTYSFLHEKGYFHPAYDVLDRVVVTERDKDKYIGIVVDSVLEQDQFHYTIQTEHSFDVVPNVKEEHLAKLE